MDQWRDVHDLQRTQTPFTDMAAHAFQRQRRDADGRRAGKACSSPAVAVSSGARCHPSPQPRHVPMTDRRANRRSRCSVTRSGSRASARPQRAQRADRGQRPVADHRRRRAARLRRHDAQLDARHFRPGHTAREDAPISSMAASRPPQLLAYLFAPKAGVTSQRAAVALNALRSILNEVGRRCRRPEPPSGALNQTDVPRRRRSGQAR